MPTSVLIARFRTAGVSSSPYAYAQDATGEATLSLIEADPYPQGSDRLLMPDQDWVALQEICAGS